MVYHMLMPVALKRAVWLLARVLRIDRSGRRLTGEWRLGFARRMGNPAAGCWHTLL